MLTLEQIQHTHPNYQAVAEQANYHYKSYVGGELYKSGSYLTQYIGENQAPGNQYAKRINSTPLDNHVQTTVDIYRSFLFRTLPKREIGPLINNPLVEQWMSNTDQEGQSMDSFLKNASDLAMVQGSTWILVDKPSYRVETEAEAIAMGIRAYAVQYTPQNVLDWYYERNVAGKMELRYIKVRESENDEYVVFTCWHRDTVEKYKVSKDGLTGSYIGVIEHEEYENPLGYIPFVFHAPLHSPVKGVGISIIADVANQQKFIYNCTSEIEQHLRIASHPTLVKPMSTDAVAGAGAILNLDESIDPGLKPYLLSPSLSTTDSILKTIDKAVEAIQRMTHTSAIQSTWGTPMSGVALQTERQLLNAKLSDISDTLRETELAMWSIWLDWQALNMPEDFHIDYPDTFDMRDEHLELDFLMKTRSSGVNNSEFDKEISRQIVALAVDDVDIQAKILNDMETESEEDFEIHTMTDPRTGKNVIVRSQAEHLALMDQGFTHGGE
tara:strand:+ start:1827 stop:3317 length:1491 start_codon:yes stop_codon:yes gene_type:complete